MLRLTSRHCFLNDFVSYTSFSSVLGNAITAHEVSDIGDVRLVANEKLKLYHNHYLYFSSLDFHECISLFHLIFNVSNASLYTSVNEMKAEIHVIFPCVETILFFACVENLILSVESLIGHHFEYTPLFSSCGAIFASYSQFQCWRPVKRWKNWHAFERWAKKIVQVEPGVFFVKC